MVQVGGGTEALTVGGSVYGYSQIGTGSPLGRRVFTPVTFRRVAFDS
jgi:hypothetical protein